MNTPLFGILMIVFTVLFVGAGGVALVVTALQRRAVGQIAFALTLAFSGWSMLYGGALVGTSLASEARVLERNEAKAFCGFYLDCHMHATLVDVAKASEVGPVDAVVRATGMFYVVRLRISSDARAAANKLLDPVVRVRDAAGRVFGRSLTAESAMAAARGPLVPLDQILEAGGAFETTVAFDVPAGARGLTLEITEGFLIDRVLEQFLIGDEDSLLHKRTVFRLPS